jgi:hypothetical protein
MTYLKNVLPDASSLLGEGHAGDHVDEADLAVMVWRGSG